VKRARGVLLALCGLVVVGAAVCAVLPEPTGTIRSRDLAMLGLSLVAAVVLALWTPEDARQRGGARCKGGSHRGDEASSSRVSDRGYIAVPRSELALTRLADARTAASRFGDEETQAVVEGLWLQAEGPARLCAEGRGPVGAYAAELERLAKASEGALARLRGN